MKIRAKLITLVLGVATLLGAALGLYLYLLRPIAQIERERGFLTAVDEAIEDQLLELNRLPYTPLMVASESFGAACKEVGDAFAKLSAIELLPSINEEMRSALEVITNLKSINDAWLDKLNKDSEIVKADMRDIYHFIDSFAFTNLYTDQFKPEQQAKVAMALPHLAAFMSDLKLLQGALLISRQTIDAQYSIIDAEIGEASAQAIAVATVIAAAIFLITILLAILSANGIARSIIYMEKNIASLKTGDLTGRAAIRTRDEIGILAGNLNQFIDRLSSSLLRIKEISKANLEEKNRLFESTAEATSSAAQIESSAASIGSRIRNFDARIEESVGSVMKIVGSIVELNAQIEKERAMVDEATASMMQILSSLDSMGRIAEKDRASAEDLVRVAERSRGVFESAFAKIGEIPENVGMIREMAEVIKGIASRTNLLAMNAAIEAAHAGDYGKGFAVVADEMRKLSEASTESSKEIAKSINGIISKIDGAMTANSDIGRAFALIDERIKEVSMSMEEIFSRIGEMQIGGKRTLESMAELHERSTKVKEGSASMEEGSAEIQKTVEDLSRISAEVAGNISEITGGMTEIGVSIRLVAEVAEKVETGSLRLDEEVSKFKTSAEEVPSA